MELMEPFKKDSQVGSSAMPAKRNPVKSERICSLAKLMRGLLIPAYENIALWHERDLTNSANERFIFSMSFILLDDMTNSMNKMLAGLVVFPDNMKRNLALTGGLNLSENVVKTLVEKGMGRQEAHEIVRNCSMKSITKKIPFSTVLMEDEKISTLISQNEIKLVLDHSKYLGVTTKLIKNAIATTKSELENN
jgi:adenylosuccinate lyase